MPAVYAIDPRAVALGDMVRLTTDVSRAGRRLRRERLQYNYVSTLTQLTRELFASTEGALIDQAFALTQGLCYVVAIGGRRQPGDLRRAAATSAAGRSSPTACDEPLIAFPPFADFALALARETRSSWRPRRRCRPRTARSSVVTDPHYNTLVSHEIVGHPVELDRALKMETAYAGRSWLLARPRRPPGRQAHRLAAGERVLRSRPCPATATTPTTTRARRRGGSSTSTTACSPGFMNSRQTAAIFGGEPNGHCKATDASLVPLIRMSSTVFAGGERDPARHHPRGRPRLLPGRPPHPVDRREPRELPDLRAQGLRDPATASSAGSTATAASWPTAATS